MDSMRRVRFFSKVMLAVFLPALILSSVHKHPVPENESEECYECVHHLPHAGHLSAGHSGIHECVLCHFLGLPFLSSVRIARLPLLTILLVLGAVSEENIRTGFEGDLRTRAPPVSDLL